MANAASPAPMQRMHTLEGAIICGTPLPVALPGDVQGPLTQALSWYQENVDPLFSINLMHYGVVSEVDANGAPTTVIDYDGVRNVRRKSISTWVSKNGEVWLVVKYSPTPHQAVQRANRAHAAPEEWLNKFHPLFRNCQTFATYCCFGDHWSHQVEQFLLHAASFLMIIFLGITVAVVALTVLSIVLWLLQLLLAAVGNVLVAVLWGIKAGLEGGIDRLAILLDATFIGTGTSIATATSASILKVLGCGVAYVLYAVGFVGQLLVAILRLVVMVPASLVHGVGRCIAHTAVEAVGAVITLAKIFMFLFNTFAKLLVVGYCAFRAMMIINRHTRGNNVLIDQVSQLRLQ